MTIRKRFRIADQRNPANARTSTTTHRPLGDRTTTVNLQGSPILEHKKLKLSKSTIENSSRTDQKKPIEKKKIETVFNSEHVKLQLFAPTISENKDPNKLVFKENSPKKQKYKEDVDMEKETDTIRSTQKPDSLKSDKSLEFDDFEQPPDSTSTPLPSHTYSNPSLMGSPSHLPFQSIAIPQIPENTALNFSNNNLYQNYYQQPQPYNIGPSYSPAWDLNQPIQQKNSYSQIHPHENFNPTSLASPLFINPYLHPEMNRINTVFQPDQYINTEYYNENINKVYRHDNLNALQYGKRDDMGNRGEREGNNRNNNNDNDKYITNMELDRTTSSFYESSGGNATYNDSNTEKNI